jgi:hypothetical protein
VRELEGMAVDLLAKGEVTTYAVGTRPAFDAKQAAVTPVGSQAPH